MKPEVTVETVRAALEKRGVNVTEWRLSVIASVPGFVVARCERQGAPRVDIDIGTHSDGAVSATLLACGLNVWSRAATIDDALGTVAHRSAVEANKHRDMATTMDHAHALLTPKPKTEPTA